MSHKCTYYDEGYCLNECGETCPYNGADERVLSYDVAAIEDTPYGIRLRFEDNSYINFNSTYYWREIK